MAQTSVAPSNPFIKQLANNDRQVRDKAVHSLRTFLSRNTPFSDLDFLKLWKGLFYCMWSCDKPGPQRRLALDLAELVSLLSTRTNFLRFQRAFWVTMAREWSGIDALRMDKFLFLVRAHVHAGFLFCKKGGWEDHVVRREYLDLIRELPLHPRDPKVPGGLRYHVADVWIDELEKVGAGDEGATPFRDLLGPVVELSQKALLKSVRKRVKETLDDDRVRLWLGIEREKDHDELREVEAGDEDEEFGGFDD